MIDKHLMALSEPQDAAHAPKEHLEIARDWALLMGAVGIAAAVIASLLTAAYVAIAPAWIQAPLLVAASFAFVIAIGVLRALGYARQAIAIRLFEFQENQDALREIARITATQVTSVNVKGRANVVSVNSSGGQAVETVRLVPLVTQTPLRLIDGVQEQDLLYFIQRILIEGWSKRTWLGRELPSGKLVSTFSDYDQIVAPLVKANIIADRGERSAGHLTTNDPGEILGRLGITAHVQGATDQTTKDVTPNE